MCIYVCIYVCLHVCTGTKFTLVDTAGMRRRAKVAGAGEKAEELSVLRALGAIRRSDVVVLVLDGTEKDPTVQDFRIAERIAERLAS